MISYVDKGYGLHLHLSNQGYDIVNNNGTWELVLVDADEAVQAINEAAAQSLIDSYDPLPYVKTVKIDLLKLEAVTRAQAYVDFIDTFAALQYNREVFLSMAPAARNLTANMTNVQNVTTAAIDAKNAIQASNDVAFVEAYNVVTDPAWPI